MTDLSDLEEGLKARIAAAEDLAQLEALRIEALGKKGVISQAMKQLGGLAPEDRRARGQALNLTKEAVAGALEERKGALEAVALDARLAAERIDVSLPARPAAMGPRQPQSHMWGKAQQEGPKPLQLQCPALPPCACAWLERQGCCRH